MPVNEAIANAKQVETLLEELTKFQLELDRINTYRTELIHKIAGLNSQYNQKKNDLKQSTQDL